MVLVMTSSHDRPIFKVALLELALFGGKLNGQGTAFDTVFNLKPADTLKTTYYEERRKREGEKNITSNARRRVSDAQHERERLRA